MDGVNGRAAHEASSDDDSSDFYFNRDAPQQPAVDLPAEDSDAQQPAVISLAMDTSAGDTDTVQPAVELPLEDADALNSTVSLLVQADTSNQTADDDDDDDVASSSAMDMDQSESATPEPMSLPSGNATVTATADASQAGTKRKLSNTAADHNSVVTESTDEPLKRRKVDDVEAEGEGTTPKPLPAQLWQRVFLHLSPAMLCRCLCVCKQFNFILTEERSRFLEDKKQSVPMTMDSGAIWALTRKDFYPSLPRPLLGFSELEMLELVFGRGCQFCDRLSDPTPPATSPFTAGPGRNGVRVIWPFRIRSCGECLERVIMKDLQVLRDSHFQSLRFGIPHGYRSPELHFAFESMRQMPGGIPTNLGFAKFYYIPDLRAVLEEERDAEALGQGAASEWRKGLAARGKNAMNDSARWEKWELSMKPGIDFGEVLREYDPSSFTPRPESESKPAGSNGLQPPVAANGAHPLPQPVHVFHNGYGTSFPQQPQQLLQQVPLQHSLQQPQIRPVRNAQEAEQARQARKTEIERRCQQLEVPLEPNVLQHMECFQAAMQITAPMDDTAWDVLKPRILAQRQAAELAEREKALHSAPFQAKDSEYEQVQEPLRKRLGEYADDYINGQWSGGKNVGLSNVFIFAIHVLLHVRKRYFEDKAHDLLPKFELLGKNAASGLGSPPPEPFLSLDNMKWVYDNKVKPLTDVHHREVFLCAGCTEEKKPKWFAFEGLIQHYGAKHTTAFSKGNIIVHWQTVEWPEEPPFNVNPSNWSWMDRKHSELKGYGRARRTPQNIHEGPFSVPPPHLPENPYHSVANGRTHDSPGHLSVYSGLPTHATSNGHFYQAAVEPQPLMHNDVQVSKLSGDARNVWNALIGVKDLEGCIHIQTVIHHTVTRFFEQFRQKPLLDLVTDALTTNAQLRPLKNTHGLVCKQCIASSTNGAGIQGSYWARIRGAKLYNVVSMMSHFKLVHQANDASGYLDWTKDMIELPENQIVNELLHTPGMDDDKLALVAAAFPEAFPVPLPHIGLITEETSAHTDEDPSKNRLLGRLNKKPKPQQSKKKGKNRANGASNQGDSQEPISEPVVDEYDPRGPVFSQRAMDSAWDDTNAHGQVNMASSAPNGDGLNPQTRGLLQSLGTLPVQPALNLAEGRRSRSPSVGRASPAPWHFAATSGAGPPDIAAILAAIQDQVQHPVASRHSPGPSVGRVIPTPMPPTIPSGAIQPDIAAILSALKNHAPPESSTRPPTASNVHHQIQGDLNVTPQFGNFPSYVADHRRPSDGNNGPYQPTPAPSNKVQELEAALSSFRRQPEQDRGNTYVNAPYVPLAHPVPRQHHAYEGEAHFSQSLVQTPMYIESAPQYYQQPEKDHAPPGYQLERAGPRATFYIDEYGRRLELTPIPSAPAPMQYAPFTHGGHEERPVLGPVPSAVHLQPLYNDHRPYYGAHPQGSSQRFSRQASVPRP